MLFRSTTRVRRRRDATGGVPASSSDVVGVDVDAGETRPCGALIASMRTSRRSETEIVASAAISRASDTDRGFVVNTTKYDSALDRAKVAGCGSVT